MKYRFPLKVYSFKLVVFVCCFSFLNCSSQKIFIPSLEKTESINGTYIMPQGKSKSDFKIINFNADVILKKGTVFSFHFDINKVITSNFQERGCVGGVGLIIADYQFYIENNKKDLRIYIDKKNKKNPRYYIIDSHVDNTNLIFFVRLTQNGLEWAIKSNKIIVGDVLSYNLDSTSISKFIYKPISGNELEYKVSDFNNIVNVFPNYKKAKLHPLLQYEKTTTSKNDWDTEAAKHLVLDAVKGVITDNEFKGFEKYLLEFELPKHNHLNYYFRKRMNSYMIEWLYNKNKNIALLNKSLEFAQRAVDYRNDNFGKHIIDFDRSVAPLWPNYKEVEVYDDGTTGLVPGASVFAGLAPITVPIRIIANHPEIWHLKYNGITYKEVALKLIDEAFKTTDYSYKVFVRDQDNLIKYPTTFARKDWRNRLFIYNRVFPLLTGAIPLVESLEKFDMLPEKRKKIDAVNQAMIDRLKRDIEFYTVNGKECMKYPYSEAMKAKKPNSSEDFSHGAFDSRDFQLFYLSNRYDFSERYVNAMANTLVEVVYKKDRGFTYDIAGNGKIRKKYTNISYIGYMWYASNREEIYDVIIKHVLDENIVFKNDRYDSYFIYEILKLKEK